MPVLPGTNNTGSGVLIMRMMILFTNRNCMVFDGDGNQVIEYQRAINCYSVNPEKAQETIDYCEEYYIASWRDGWKHKITKKETEYLLGLRTRERDLPEATP
jgi:hypothetical protein